MQIIAVHASRNGTGKSTIVANLAAQLVLRGQRVMVVDANLMSPAIHAQFGLSPHEISFWLNNVLAGEAALEDAVIYLGDRVARNAAGLSKLSGLPLWILPADPDPAAIRSSIQQGYDIAPLLSGLTALQQELQPDILLIDTEPGLQEQAMFLLVVASSTLLTIRPVQEDFQGCATLLKFANSLNASDIKLVANQADTEQYSANVIEQQISETFNVPIVRALPLTADIMRLHTTDLYALRHPDRHWSVALDAVASTLLS